MVTSEIGKTLFDKIWDSHVVTEVEGETLVYVDRLLLHEGSRHSFSMSVSYTHLTLPTILRV